MNDVQAEDVVRRAAEHRELMGDWRLFVRDNGADVEVTVLSVLDNPSHYHGMQTYDPLEPDYDGGRLVGKLHLRLRSDGGDAHVCQLQRPNPGVE